VIRRPYRTPLREARIARDDADGGALVLELFLPAGSYATAVIGEIVKAPKRS
jgi:tRNA(Glu) U13 pseudouridine synthase TruD